MSKLKEMLHSKSFTGIFLLGFTLASYLGFYVIEDFVYQAQFYVLSAGVGFVLTVGVALAMPVIFDEKESKPSFLQFMGLFLTIFCYSILCLGLMNEIYASVDSETVEATVVRKVRTSGRDEPTYFLFLRTKNYEKRLSVDEQVWRVAKRGAPCQLKIKEGLLGFPIVESFQWPQPPPRMRQLFNPPGV